MIEYAANIFSAMRKEGMKVLGNTASVRKYYRSHRNDIIKQKTLHACKQEGRIPRLSTMQKHQMQWNDVLLSGQDPVDGNGMKANPHL